MSKKTLTDKQNEAINLLVLGNMSKLQIAKSVDIAEKTLYNWINDNELFREELQKRTDIFAETQIKDAKIKLATHLDMAIARIVEIASDKTNTKSFEASKYLIDRNLGGISTKIEQSISTQDNNNDNNSETSSYLEQLEKDILNNESEE
jgi:transposase